MILKEGNKLRYEVLFPKSVRKELDKINDVYYSKICSKINEMEQNPRLIGSIKLSDSDEYRIIVGVYRILYEINDIEKKVYIYKIDHRKDIYKKR